ncbi:MAG: hypothetical protein U0V48_08945 [Anaerolineales bacterium]
MKVGDGVMLGVSVNVGVKVAVGVNVFVGVDVFVFVGRGVDEDVNVAVGRVKGPRECW